MTSPFASGTREKVLVSVVKLRSACQQAGEQRELPARMNEAVAALSAWAALPAAGRQFYAKGVADALFEVAADVGDDDQLTADERETIELSLWDAAELTQLLPPTDARSGFAAKRRIRLRQSAVARAANDAERLLYRWADLLRPREAVCRSLPGPLRADAEAVVDLLASLGLPRRAKVLAGKFQVPLSQLAQWTIKHRPSSEETERNRALVGRVRAPVRPVALEAIHYARWLERVLLAPLESVPLVVGTGGVITIAGEAFGVVPPSAGHAARVAARR